MEKNSICAYKMPINTLTDSQCRLAKPDLKPRKMFDGHGLYLYVYPNGSKSWRMAYRVDGKAQTAAFGMYPVLSLAGARAKRDELRKMLLHGDVVKKAPVAVVVTLKAATEAYWGGRQDVSTSYKTNAMRGIEMHLWPALGDKPIGSVTKELLMTELNRMNSAGLFVYVRKVRVWIGQVFDWAEAQGHATTNPTKSIDPRKAFGRRKVKSFAAVELTEVRALMERLGFENEIQSVLACRMLALTWVRTNELRMMLWTEIDKDLWRIPAGKMKREKDHLVPLAPQAVAILETMKARSRGSIYVFPNDRRADRPMSENAVLYLLHRMGYKGEMTGHGWRSVASTWANERGYDDDHIERQLSHVPADQVRATYNRARYLKQRRAIMVEWANWLDNPDASGLEG